MSSTGTFYRVECGYDSLATNTYDNIFRSLGFIYTRNSKSCRL